MIYESVSTAGNLSSETKLQALIVLFQYPLSYPFQTIVSFQVLLFAVVYASGLVPARVDGCDLISANLLVGDLICGMLRCR